MPIISKYPQLHTIIQDLNTKPNLMLYNTDHHERKAQVCPCKVGFYERLATINSLTGKLLSKGKSKK